VKEVEKDGKKEKKETANDMGGEDNNIERDQHTPLNQESNGQLGNCMDDYQDQKLDQILGCNGAMRYYPLLRWEMIAGVMHVFEVDTGSSDSDVKSGESETDGVTKGESKGEKKKEGTASVPSTPPFSVHLSTDKVKAPHSAQADSSHSAQKSVGLYPVLSFDEFVKDFTYVRTASNCLRCLFF
jgi:hypothetical protein